MQNRIYRVSRPLRKVWEVEAVPRQASSLGLTNHEFLLNGLVRTFSQLVRLGLGCIIVVEAGQHDGLQTFDPKLSREVCYRQAQRLVSALEKLEYARARRLDELLDISTDTALPTATVSVRGEVEVRHSKILARTMQNGLIPVITPVAYTEDSQRLVDIDTNEAVMAIVRYLAGVGRGRGGIENEVRAQLSAGKIEDPTARHILDRIIVIDPDGAIPSAARSGGGHVFLNMEQEYQQVRSELLQQREVSHQGDTTQHIRNLDLLHNALALLPPSASALLTKPSQAASLRRQETDTEAFGVQTRRPKNPLIFNLLTDKPLISSSLPSARMNGTNKTALDSQQSPLPQATFAKRGMPVTILPDPRVKTWKAPRKGENRISLGDPHLDFPRLLHLIEDSFNRPLDVAHYVERIRDKIAGIIVAGEYEGGAILTWEMPPGVTDDGTESTRQRMVPYLDKFAVLKRSQGSGGVADIVFSAMVRNCFPDGVCWRSRRDNPVNKWYFERSVGTWKIRESDWTMFWTTPALQWDSQRWRDYESACRTVTPSWADNKQQLD
ncbi:MAG: hypothetical protein Q9162_004849 [Coniocarpon cinnabarinum]